MPFKIKSPVVLITTELFVAPTIQNSNFFIDDLRNAAGLEDESYNPLPHDLT